MSEPKMLRGGGTSIFISLALMAAASAIFAATASVHLGCDEPQTANIVQFSSSWADMFTNIRNDYNAPAIYILLRMWIGLFGGSDFAFKLFCVALAVLVPPAVFLHFSGQIGRRISVALGALIACCASFVHHSQLIRPYGLVALVGFVATVVLERLLKSPASWANRILYVLLLAAVPYCHMSGLIVWCGHLAVVAWNFVGKKIDSRTAITWAFCAALSFLLFLPHLITFIQTRPLQALHVDHLMPPVLLVALPRLALDCGQLSNSPFVIFGFAALFWTSFVVVVRSKERLREEHPNFPFELWVPLIVGMILAECVFAINLVREQYLVHFIVPCLLFIVLGIELLLRKAAPALRIAIPFLILMPVWIPELMEMRSERNIGIAIAAQTINDVATGENKQPFVLVSREWYGTGFGRYLRHDIPFICLPELKPLFMIDYVHSPARQGSFKDTQKVYSILEKELADGRIVFHALPKPVPAGAGAPEDIGGVEPATQQEIEQWLSQRAVLVSRREFPSCGGPILLSEYKPR